MEEVHYSGSNANVLPTDTTKNTVYASPKEHGIESAEQFGIHLARHFVTSQEPIKTARIRIEEYAWERIETSDANSKFIRRRRGQALLRAQGPGDPGHPDHDDGSSWEVISGLKDLVVMNSTNSEFWGYVKDKLHDAPRGVRPHPGHPGLRRWRFNWSGDEQKMPNWEKSYDQVRKHMLQAFAETYSLSLQQTLYQMGSRIIDNRSEIDEVRFSLPNKHHFLVDLKPFGLENDNEVYLAADARTGSSRPPSCVTASSRGSRWTSPTCRTAPSSPAAASAPTRAPASSPRESGGICATTAPRTRSSPRSTPRVVRNGRTRTAVQLRAS